MRTPFPRRQTADLVAGIRDYRRRSELAPSDEASAYWRGVAYGIQHAVRILYGTRAGDALVQATIDGERADDQTAVTP